MIAGEVHPFQTLSDLRAAHTRLLERRRATGHAREMVEDVKDFIFSAAVTGRIIDTDADRAATQGLIDYWLNALDRDGLDMEDVSLAGFDASSAQNDAETTYLALNNNDRRCVELVLNRLVQPDASHGNGIAANPRRRNQLVRAGDKPDELNRGIELLEMARMVKVRKADPPNPDEDLIEFAQPALARTWPRMQGWLEQERESMRDRERLSTLAERWRAAGKSKHLLVRGRLLEDAYRMDDMSPLEIEFVRASSRDRTRRNGLVITALSLALLAALAAAFVAWRESVRANRESERALSRQLAVSALQASDDTPDLGLLLGVEANRAQRGDDTRTFEARSGLMAALQRTSTELQFFNRWHEDKVWAMAMSPDGNRLATGSEDGVMVLTDISREPYRQQAKFKAHESALLALAWNADGTRIASGSGAGVVAIWDATQTPPKLVRTLRDKTQGGVLSVAFHPTRAGLLAVGGQFAGVDVFDINAPGNNPVARVNEERYLLNNREITPWIWQLAFSPDGARLAGAQQNMNAPHLWRMEAAGAAPQFTRVTTPTTVGGFVFTGVTFARKHGWLAATDTNSNLTLWDADTGNRLDGVALGTGFLWSAAFGSSDAELAVAGARGRIRVFDVRDNGVIVPNTRRLLRGHVERFNTDVTFRLQYHPTRQSQLFSAGWDNVVAVWNTDRRTQLDVLPRTERAAAIAATPGRVRVAALGEKAVFVRDSKIPDESGGSPAGSPFQIQRIPVTDTTAAALSANGDVQAAGFADGSIIVRRDGAERALGVQGRVRHLALNAGGTVLAATTDGATAVTVFNLANAVATPVSVAGTGEPVRRIALHPSEPALALAACADSECQRTEVRVHDSATGRQISTLALRPGFNPAVLAFGPAVRDGNPVIAVGGQNRTVWLFDWRTGNVLAGPLNGHVSAISAIAFGGDSLLATGEEDQDGDPQVILWDISQGQRLGGAFIGHTDGIAALAFGGSRLASVGRDGRVMIWPADEYLNSGTRRACQLANRNMTPEEWDRYLPEQPYRETCAAASR